MRTWYGYVAPHTCCMQICTYVHTHLAIVGCHIESLEWRSGLHARDDQMLIRHCLKLSPSLHLIPPAHTVCLLHRCRNHGGYSPPPNNFLATKVESLLAILVAKVSPPKVESVPMPLYCVHINESDFKRTPQLAQLIRYFEILCTLQMPHL